MPGAWWCILSLMKLVLALWQMVRGETIAASCWGFQLALGSSQGKRLLPHWESCQVWSILGFTEGIFWGQPSTVGRVSLSVCFLMLTFSICSGKKKSPELKQIKTEKSMSCDEACLLFRGLCYCRSKCCSTAKTYINQIAMIAGAVTTKQTVLEVLDLPLFPNAEMQGR